MKTRVQILLFLALCLPVLWAISASTSEWSWSTPRLVYPGDVLDLALLRVIGEFRTGPLRPLLDLLFLGLAALLLILALWRTNLPVAGAALVVLMLAAALNGLVASSADNTYTEVARLPDGAGSLRLSFTAGQSGPDKPAQLVLFRCPPASEVCTAVWSTGSSHRNRTEAPPRLARDAGTGAITISALDKTFVLSDLGK